MVLTSVLAAGLLVLLGAWLFTRNFHMWRFEYIGHAIEVQNHLLHETVLIDGIPVRGSRLSGDLSAPALHEVTVERARLRIWVGLVEGRSQCRVDDGTATIFDSSPVRLPALPAEDPRLAAARVLLGHLRRIDIEAAAHLESALVEGLAAERAAVATAEAHRALGATESEVVLLLGGHADAVAELLASVRELHLASAEPGTDLEPQLVCARDAAARLRAVVEVGYRELRR